MTFNMAGSYFGSEMIGYTDPNAGHMTTNNNAIIFVFKPHVNQFKDIALRPFSYRFDENFLAETQTMMDLAARGNVGESRLVEGMMDKLNFSNNMTMPTLPVGTAHLSQLSDKWRFVLMLTDGSQGTRIDNSFTTGGIGGNQLRRMYTGYFEDEPYNAARGFGEKTLNPHAILVITHKTVLGISKTSGAWGGETKIDTRTSEEIISPTLINALCTGNIGGDQGMFVMTPENVVNSVDITGEGLSVIVPGNSQIMPGMESSSVVNDLLEQPAFNVGQVMRGIVGFQDNVTSQGELNSYRAQSAMRDPALDDGFMRTKLSSYMGMHQSRKMSNFDLDVNSRISITAIDAMVNGALEVHTLEINRPMFYDTLDTHHGSITNQFSQMIATIVASVLNSAGLTTMRFEFEIANRNGAVYPNFVTFDSGTSHDITPQIRMLKVKSVESELTRGIFKTIFEAMGDFHVAVSCSTTGMTAVRLSLVEQGIVNHTDFEIPSCLGGIISPIIGDMNTNSNNAHSIEQFTNLATGQVGLLRNFDEDDRDFLNFAEGWGRANAQSQPYNPFG